MGLCENQWGYLGWVGYLSVSVVTGGGLGYLGVGAAIRRWVGLYDS